MSIIKTKKPENRSSEEIVNKYILSQWIVQYIKYDQFSPHNYY
jgi:hypothetical protein